MFIYESVWRRKLGMTTPPAWRAAKLMTLSMQMKVQSSRSQVWMFGFRKHYIDRLMCSIALVHISHVGYVRYVSCSSFCIFLFFNTFVMLIDPYITLPKVHLAFRICYKLRSLLLTSLCVIYERKLECLWRNPCAAEVILQLTNSIVNWKGN